MVCSKNWSLFHVVILAYIALENLFDDVLD